LLREADHRAYDLLDKHRADLDKLAEALLQREELHREELEEILGYQPKVSPSLASNGTVQDDRARDGEAADGVLAPGSPTVAPEPA
jgi:hypothetical protein